MAILSPKAVKFFEARAISGETAARMGIYTGRRVTTGDEGFAVEPDPTGDVLVFPFIDDGKEVAAKYRMAGKRFAQKPGCPKTFYNVGVLNDPVLTERDNPLVIVEGELDCLAVIEAGYPFVVSVPDGAPPARDGDGKLIHVPETAFDVDPENDGKFSFIANNWERLKWVKHIILAVDGDEPGQRLAAELVRRLGRPRCSFVTYPAKDCVTGKDGALRPAKDMNEILEQFGSEAVLGLIKDAQPYPVSGVYKFSQLPNEPEPVPVTTGWGRLDPYLKLYAPALMVVTGPAGHGKSTWTTQLSANIATIHGWGVGIASFEMRTKYVADGLRSAFLDGKLRRDWTELDKARSLEWLEKNFVFIAPEPDDEDVHDVAWILDKAAAAVIRHGIKVLLVDPWNELEHARRRDESPTEYVGRALQMIKSFARRYGVLVIVVAHPTKGSVANKAIEDLSLYDIADSAHFQNKADLGVVIARMGDPTVDTLSAVFVKKVRYQPDAGKQGVIELNYDQHRRTFSQ